MVPVLLLLLAGCGGGGGGGGGGGPPTSRTPPPLVPIPTGGNAVEHYRSMGTIAGQEGLLLIRAPQAYANLYRSGLSAVEASRPGNGVTIGFIDDDLIQFTPSFYDWCCQEKNVDPNTGEEFLFVTQDKIRKRVTQDGVPEPEEVFKSLSVAYYDGAKSWRERDAQGDVSFTRDTHGTEVASVAAGSQFTFKQAGEEDYSFQGVAPGANIKMFAVPVDLTLPAVDFTNTYLLNNPNLFDFFPEAFTAALAPDSGVDFLNVSLSIPYSSVEGTDLPIDFDDPTGPRDRYTEAALRVAAGDFIRIAAQHGRRDKTVIVYAAANIRSAGADNPNSPNAPGGLMAHIPELRGHTVVVVSVDRSGEIASNSKRCGIAARWCIAAPGRLLLGADMLFDFDAKGDARWRAGINPNLSGTSFAAPMVSGGLALMKQIFRGQMSNTKLLARLLQTANKEGRYAHAGENEDGKLYGQGLMDLGAATQPSGTTSIASGSSVDGAGIALSDTALSLGSAFGDGLARSLGGQEVVAFDSLGAPFWHRLGGLTNLATFAPLGAQLRGFMGQGADFSGGTGWPASRRQSAGAEAGERDGIGAGAFSGGGHLSLAADASAARLGFASTSAGVGDFAVTAFAPIDHGADGSRPAPMYAATLSRRLSDTQADFGFGWIVEPKSMLGSSADGAFGELSANTAFAGLGWRGEVGAWRLNFNSEVGIAIPDQTAAPGLLNRISSLTTSAFDFGATRTFSEGSRLRLSLSQPLRVERGQADLSVPVSRTPDGLVQRDHLTADLAPSGRQLDIGVRVALPVRFGEILLGAVGSHHPNHNRDAPTQMSYLAGWRWEF